MDLKFPVNFLRDSQCHVVTDDGEIIGTWGTDETDAIYEFTPLGAGQPLLTSPFMGDLSEQVQAWMRAKEDAGAE